MNVLKHVPEMASQQLLDRYGNDAIFWHEGTDDQGRHRVGLFVHDSRLSHRLHILDHYRFASEDDAENEALRLNDSLGYNVVQLVSLRCALFNWCDGEPIVFTGSAPNCTVRRIPPEEYYA